MGRHEHDSCDGENYQRRCSCNKCSRKYDEWCRKNKRGGEPCCKRICRTVCEVVCEKPTTTVHKWGYKEQYDGKWEHHRGEEVPRRCGGCMKPAKECSCRR